MKQWLVIGWMVLAAGGILLTACGQKGPLYLPDEPAHQQRQQ